MGLSCGIFVTLYILLFLLSSVLSLPIDSEIKSCVTDVWKDYLGFVAINYIAHAAASPSQPGGNWMENFFWVFLSFMLPFAGLGRAAALVFNHFVNDPGHVERAMAQGAVIVAARLPGWKPSSNKEQLVYVKFPAFTMTRDLPEVRLEVLVEDIFPINDRFFKFRETCLSSGYGWAIPYQRVVRSVIYSNRKHVKEAQISRSQSSLKMWTSIGQLVLSSITLYSARNSQIDRYGYASFGLSVFPYTLMSLVNFICVYIVGDYPSLYILRTPILDEAEEVQVKNVVPDNDGSGILPGGDSATNGSANVVEDKSDAGLSGLTVEAQDKIPALKNEVSGIHAIHGNGIDTKYSGGGHDVGLSGCTAAWLRTEGDILIFRTGNDVRQFRLVHRPDVPALLVDCITNTENSSVREKPSGAQKFLLITPLITTVLIASVVPYLFNFGLTRFQARGSTVAERAWMTSWLVANQIACILVSFLCISAPNFSWSSLNRLRKVHPSVFWRLAPFFLPLPLLFIPAVGGFVVVSAMFFDFRSCKAVL